MPYVALRRSLLALLVALITVPAFGQADLPVPLPSATTPTVFDQPALVQQYQATITPEDLAAHLYLFASDLFEGRETATRGQKLAAHYLASQYRKMGVQPKGTAPTDNLQAPEAYFQPFPLYGRRLASAQLAVEAGGETMTTTFGPDAKGGEAYLAFGNMQATSAPVVFAGYGITDEELGYDDYAALREAGIDATGKWLMMLRDEPLASEDESLLPTADGKPSKWTMQTFEKLRAAFGAGGPAGILLVGDVGPRGVDMAERVMQRAEAIQQDVGNLSLNEGVGSRPFPPIYVISQTLANQILAPTGQTVAALQADIDDDLTPVVMDVPGATVSSEIAFETFETSSENVVAFIEGSDPVLKDEVVVISSHYDHIGIDPVADGDQINNGADDDGSGTVTILEIAEAFEQARRDGYGPRRSVLFLNVSGEEKGLLGSAFYTDIEPVVPLANTVANLNIDMIGRHDPTHPDPASAEDYVYIIGSNLISQELHDINVRANEVTGTDVVLSERFNSKDDPNQFYRRSDHWNFGKNNIPFIFFFTGTHEDYHQPGDEAHKIDYERMARIGQLIFATAWQVANQDAPPAVSGAGFN